MSKELLKRFVEKVQSGETEFTIHMNNYHTVLVMSRDMSKESLGNSKEVRFFYTADCTDEGIFDIDGENAPEYRLSAIRRDDGKTASAKMVRGQLINRFAVDAPICKHHFCTSSEADKLFKTLGVDDSFFRSADSLTTDDIVAISYRGKEVYRRA